MIFKIRSRRVFIAPDLFGKLLEGGKLPLVAQKAVKLHPRLPSIEITRIIQQMAFHADTAAVADRGANADIRDGDVAAAILQKHLRGVNAVARNEHPLGEAHIDRRCAEVRAEMITGTDSVRERVRMTEKAVRRFNIAFCYKLTYICGTDNAPVDFERRDDVTADAVRRAVFRKPRRRALTPVAKAEVVPDDYPRNAKFADD